MTPDEFRQVVREVTAHEKPTEGPQEALVRAFGAWTPIAPPTVPNERQRAALRAWLDRKPPEDRCGGCGKSIRECWDSDIRCCSTCEHPDVKPWDVCWFNTDGEYLGTRSARTGPDPTGAAQRCGCEVCLGTVTP